MSEHPDEVVVVTPGDRMPGPPTPGMDRQQALATGDLWAGYTRTEAGMMSGWHHHGEYETVVYVLSGALRMESGPDGSSIVEAAPGDFVYVPRGAVHRESNPTDQPSVAVIARAGGGTPTVNVDPPQ